MSNQDEVQNDSLPTQAEAAEAERKKIKLPLVTIVTPASNAEDPVLAKYFKPTGKQCQLPECVEMAAEDITGEDLGTLGAILFTGRAVGTPGLLPAQELACLGHGQPLGHPCDEMGRLSIGTNLYNLSEPLWIGVNTMQFALVHRQAVETMVGLRAAAMRAEAAAAPQSGKEGFHAANDSKVASPGMQQGPPPETSPEEEPAEAK